MHPTISAIGITRISGRPLHSYRINDAAFKDLQSLLARSLPNFSLRDTLSMPFVLWSAERFRRAFDGGHFTWAFLFDEIGLPVDQTLGRSLVQDGLSRFKRPEPPRTDGGVIYLKTLAAEGGLPEKLLDEGGRYRRVVIGLMNDIESLGQGMAVEGLTILAAQRADSLPSGFRTQEFHQLFAKFANILVELKNQCPKDLPSEAREAWLDSHTPGWRRDLPLRIETAAARSLLSEAIRADRQDQGRDVITRQLSRGADGNWRAKLGVAERSSLPGWLIDGLPPGLRRFRLSPGLAMSESCPALLISAEQDEAATGLWLLRRESGPRTGLFDFPLEKVVTFQMMADGKVIHSFAPPGGASVDPSDVPSFWGSDSDRPEAESLRHLGSASVRTRKEQVWLLLPRGVVPKFEGTLTVEPDGLVGEHGLWRLTGEGFVFGIGLGYRYRIKTRADDDHLDRLIAHGPIVEGMRDPQGGPIWRGCPQFMVSPSNGPARAVKPEEMMWRAGTSVAWKQGAPKDAAFGTIQVGWRGSEGAVQAIESIQVLPKAAKVEVKSRSNGGVATKFIGLPADTTIAMPPLPHQRIGFERQTEFLLDANQSSAARLGFVIFDPTSGLRLDASVAKPSDRGWIIAPGDRVLDHEASIDLEDLRSWRIAIPPDRPSELQLQLVDTVASIAHPNVMITVTAETALTSFLPLFRGLLAIGGPDAKIRLRLIVGPHESPRLVLRRFVRQALWTPDSLVIVPSDAPVTAIAKPTQGVSDDNRSAEAKDQIGDLTCINLECPEITVKISAISDTNTILERLSEDCGPWLVLPRDTVGIVRPPRPILANVEPGNIARFSEAFRFAGQSPTRTMRILGYAKALININSVSGIGDIGLLSHLLDVVGDTSDLAVLDQVVALALAPAAAISLVFRCDPARIGDRLTLEDSSPFLWSTTPITAWTEALKVEVSVATGRLQTMGLDEATSTDLAQQLLAKRLTEVMVRRTDLSGHVFLSAMESGLFPRHRSLFGRVPAEFNQPADSLVRLARSAITRAEAKDQLFDNLLARSVPEPFATFNPALRGLTDIPIVAAEYATGQRKGAPPASVAIAILHFRMLDPTYFDTALPAAVAWLSQGKS